MNRLILSVILTTSVFLSVQSVELSRPEEKNQRDSPMARAMESLIREILFPGGVNSAKSGAGRPTASGIAATPNSTEKEEMEASNTGNDSRQPNVPANFKRYKRDYIPPGTFKHEVMYSPETDEKVVGIVIKGFVGGMCGLLGTAVAGPVGGAVLGAVCATAS